MSSVLRRFFVFWAIIDALCNHRFPLNSAALAIGNFYIPYTKNVLGTIREKIYTYYIARFSKKCNGGAFMKKNVVKVVLFFAALSLFAGNAFAAKKAKKQKSKTIVVGTGTNMKPKCFLDENGELAGYEIDIIREIDKLLPQYEIVFETYDFKNILLALSAGKIDVGAHQYEYNPERAKNYLFSDYGYNSYNKFIAVLAQRNDIRSWDDLAGKNLQVGIGSATLTEVQNYNNSVAKEKQINAIVTTNATYEQILAAMKNGTYDAFITTKADLDQRNKEFGSVYKIVDEEHPVAENSAYHIFNKKDAQLKADWDKALKTLIDNGTISRLSVKWLGADYTH